MNAGFETLDYIIFAVYVVIIVAVGLYLSRGTKGKERSGEDYFLAGRNLTWWAIGASLIAANISAEHFIGMSGSGYALGLGIAAYEWMAAITLILVAKYFLPIFLSKGIFTTNQFLAGRFNQGVSSGFAILWLLIYVFVNLTTVTYLGSQAIEAVMFDGVSLQGTIFEWAYHFTYDLDGEIQGVAQQIFAAIEAGGQIDMASISLSSPVATDLVQAAQGLGDKISSSQIAEAIRGNSAAMSEINVLAEESGNFKGKVLLGILALGFLSAIYSIYGGLVAVAWTDVIQVIFLIGGGLVTTYIVLDFISDGSIFEGFRMIARDAADHFDMVIEKGTTKIPGGPLGQRDAFGDLPGLAVIFGAMWLTNLGYWGFNQYIIQKGLAARSMKEAKQGLIFAGILKILIPLIVVIPGIAAYYLLNTDDPAITAKMTAEMGSISKSDQAYPWLLKNFVPTGIRGLAFAALVAAIVSSLASMINSTSTIFTMDIYRPLINKKATERQLVSIGRIVAFVALLISSLVAQPLLGGFDQVFQYIQEYTGLIYPGIAVVFSMGLFWKKANTKAAIAVAILTFPLGIGAKLLFPQSYFDPDMFPGGYPFLLRMGYVFIVLLAVASLFIFFDKSSSIPDDRLNEGEDDLPLTEGNVYATEKVKPLTNKVRSSMVTTSYVFGGLGLLSLIGALATFHSLRDIGIEAFIFLGTLLSTIGIVLYTNAKSPTRDKGAIGYTPDLFSTGMIFNIGAATITLIVAILYAMFW